MRYSRPDSRIGERRNRFEYQLPPDQERALQSILRAKRLDMSLFRDTHTPEKIEADLAYVQERESEWNRQNPEVKQRGDLCEAIVHAGIDNGQWFGAESRSLPIHKVDDYRNGVDVLVETERNGGFSHLALGIDVTSSDIEVSKKLGRTTDRLKRGNLTKVEYFHSPAMSLTGKLDDVPLVVVGLDPTNMKDLAPLLPAGQRQLLQRETTQFVILEQIHLQLQAFQRYVSRLNERYISVERKKQIIQRYDRISQMVGQMLQEKAGLKEELFIDERDYNKVLRADKVFAAIEQSVKHL